MEQKQEMMTNDGYLTDESSFEPCILIQLHKTAGEEIRCSFYNNNHDIINDYTYVYMLGCIGQ